MTENNEIKAAPVSTARFCSNCGVPVALSSKFCGHCGKQQEDNVAIPLPSAHGIGDISSIEFGTIRKRLQSTTWGFLASKNLEEAPTNLFPEFPSDYTATSMIDVVVTDNYFIVLKAPSMSVVQKFNNNIPVYASVGGIAGGVIGLGVALVGTSYEKIFGDSKTYEKIFGNSNKLDGHLLAACFKYGNMMFAKRIDTVCHEIKIKEDILSFTLYNIAVTGIFHHVRHNNIDLAFYFSDKNELIKALEGAGWDIYRSGTKFTSISLAGESLAPKYLNSVQHHEKLAKWCAKCIHYRPTPDWVTIDKDGLVHGLIHSKLRVTNNKLPCKIPEQVSEVWDRYFSSPQYRRQKYATDCPRFTEA